MHDSGAEQRDEKNGKALQVREDQPKKKVYEAPKVTKKRSVARVTLFSGGGATAGGLTAAG